MAFIESFLVRIAANMSEFWIRVGKVDEYHLIAIVYSMKYAARSLLRMNRSEAVGKECLVAVLQSHWRKPVRDLGTAQPREGSEGGGHGVVMVKLWSWCEHREAGGQGLGCNCDGTGRAHPIRGEAGGVSHHSLRAQDFPSFLCSLIGTWLGQRPSLWDVSEWHMLTEIGTTKNIVSWGSDGQKTCQRKRAR